MKFEKIDFGVIIIVAFDVIIVFLGKIKVEVKCDRVKVENGDDGIIIVENVIIMFEIVE